MTDPKEREPTGKETNQYRLNIDLNDDDDNESTNLAIDSEKVSIDHNRSKALCHQRTCYMYIILCVFTLIATLLSIIAIIRNKPVTPSKQFHHTSLSIETSSYKDTDAPTNLLWTKDMRNYVGNIKLLNKTYINIPQNGIYLVNCALQLEIPEHHRSVVITLLVQHMPKNSKKVEVFMKKTSNTLNIREQFMIQFSEVYTLKANDTLFLMMNMAKFISTNMESSYLSISSLHLDDP